MIVCDKNKKLLLALMFTLGAVTTIAPAARADDYQTAIKLYTKGDVKTSLPLFFKETHQNPNNSNAHYYLALSYYKLNQKGQAIAQFKKILQMFPNQQVAVLSAQCLNSMGIKVARREVGGGVQSVPAAMAVTGGRQYASESADTSGLPNEARVYFQREGAGLFVNAEVNGRPIKMLFDTGAEVCSFGKNHLRDLGIKLPSGPPTSAAVGVGTSREIPCWDMTADIKLGTIYRHNVPISVQEYLDDEPLLGQSFFKDFAYTIDNGGNSIHFTRKSGIMRPIAQSVAARDPYAVPFQIHGDSIIVTGEVNGRPIPMVFDTGASGTAFTFSQLNQLGITVPDDAEVGRSMGVGGETRTLNFTVQRIRLGPIDKSNVPVHVVEQAAMSEPLLGQSFYGDWQYTIDNANHVIHFLRR